MTEAEAMAEIERLKQENERLRAVAECATRARRTIPDEVIAKHTSMTGLFWSEHDGWAGKRLVTSEGAGLSSAIRMVLSEDPKPGNRLACREMSDEQYKQYADTMDEVLEVLSRHRAITMWRRNAQ